MVLGGMKTAMFAHSLAGLVLGKVFLTYLFGVVNSESVSLAELSTILLLFIGVLDVAPSEQPRLP
jgi:Kef-type K+ transport system membrane component KefB